MAEDDDLQASIQSLESLSGAARERVGAALKAALEREAVAGGIGGGPSAAGNIFSRGWVFSRLTPTAVDLNVIRELPGVAQLNPDQFADFAGRLAELKRKADPR